MFPGGTTPFTPFLKKKKEKDTNFPSDREACKGRMVICLPFCSQPLLCSSWSPWARPVSSPPLCCRRWPTPTATSWAGRPRRRASSTRAHPTTSPATSGATPRQRTRSTSPWSSRWSLQSDSRGAVALSSADHSPAFFYFLCLHATDAKQEQSARQRRDVQPLPLPAALRQHVHHHLLPSQPGQVRLPPGLALQDLHAQLRGGQAPKTNQWSSLAHVS